MSKNQHHVAKSTSALCYCFVESGRWMGLLLRSCGVGRHHDPLAGGRFASPHPRP